MNTHNTALYSELHKKLVVALKDQQSQSSSSNLPDVAVPAGGGGPSSASNDSHKDQMAIVGNAASVREWIDLRNKKAALKLEKLDTDLKNYKSNAIKVRSLSLIISKQPLHFYYILGKHSKGSRRFRRSFFRLW